MLQVYSSKLRYDSIMIGCKMCDNSHMLFLEWERDQTSKYKKLYKSVVSYQCPILSKWSNYTIEYSGKQANIRVVNVL